MFVVPVVHLQQMHERYGATAHLWRPRGWSAAKARGFHVDTYDSFNNSKLLFTQPTTNRSSWTLVILSSPLRSICILVIIFHGT